MKARGFGKEKGLESDGDRLQGKRKQKRAEGVLLQDTIHAMEGVVTCP